MPQKTFTVSSVPGGGSTTLNVVGMPNLSWLTRINVVPSAAGQSYRVQFYEKDTYLTADLGYDSGAVTGTHDDPVENDGGVITPRAEGSAVVCVLEDEDASGEWHVKVINNDASARNFDFTVDYLEPLVPGVALTQQFFIDGGADQIQLRVQANSTQTADIVSVENSSGTALVKIGPAGKVGVNKSTPSAQLDIGCSGAAVVGLSVDGAVGQTEDLFHLKVNGVEKFVIQSDGSVGKDLIFAGSNNVYKTVDTLNLAISGGNATNAGANLLLYGGTHASLAGVLQLRSGATNTVRVNADGGVGIGTSAPGASALLDLTSTTRGFLAPRMTTGQRNAISSPATGLIIFNTTTNKINVYSGTGWEAVTSA